MMPLPKPSQRSSPRWNPVEVLMGGSNRSKKALEISFPIGRAPEEHIQLLRNAAITYVNKKRRLLASSLVDSRINVHAASVCHLTFTTSIYMIPADYYAAVSDAIRNNTPVPGPYSVSDDSDSASEIGNVQENKEKKKVPPLSGLTRLIHKPSSPSERVDDVLASNFVIVAKIMAKLTPVLAGSAALTAARHEIETVMRGEQQLCYAYSQLPLPTPVKI
ncbi:hypothetical protein VTO58DRAFT_100536 [Aureobasidium pullulans]